MVSGVSSNPAGGNLIFLRHLDANFVQKWQKCQICVIYESLNWLENFGGQRKENFMELSESMTPLFEVFVWSEVPFTLVKRIE